MKIVKLGVILALFAGVAVVEADENIPEIEGIDRRIEELKTIWRQEQAIINGYTKNRTVPVREGSKEFRACAEASKRIQQAEAEAKELKARRSSLSAADPSVVTHSPEDYVASENLEKYRGYASRMKEFWSASWAEEKNRKLKSEPKIVLSNQKERESYALSELEMLNPMNFLHGSENFSPTLDLLKAQVSLEGKDLKEIEMFYKNNDFLDLLSLIKGESMSEYPDKEEIDKLCRKLAEKDFFIKFRAENPTSFFIKTGTNAKGVEESEISLIPLVFPVERNKSWFATNLLGSAEKFEVHPDGQDAGYIVKWSPSDGPVILKVPLRPEVFRKILELENAYRLGSQGTSDVFDEQTGVSALSAQRSKLLSAESQLFSDRIREISLKLDEKLQSLERKVEIGEIEESESVQIFLEYKGSWYQKIL